MNETVTRHKWFLTATATEAEIRLLQELVKNDFKLDAFKIVGEERVGEHAQHYRLCYQKLSQSFGVQGASK